MAFVRALSRGMRLTSTALERRDSLADFTRAYIDLPILSTLRAHNAWSQCADRIGLDQYLRLFVDLRYCYDLARATANTAFLMGYGG